MFCGLPISVAAEPMLAAQARPTRKGTGSRPRCRHRRATTGVIARQTMSLENTADSAPATAISAASKPAARQRQRRHAARHRGVEAAQPHLRRHHHEGEQQHDGRQVDRARRVLHRLAGEGDDRDRAEQRHARAVELQARQAAEEHAQVDDARRRRRCPNPERRGPAARRRAAGQGQVQAVAPPRSGRMVRSTTGRGGTVCSGWGWRS